MTERRLPPDAPSVQSTPRPPGAQRHGAERDEPRSRAAPDRADAVLGRPAVEPLSERRWQAIEARVFETLDAAAQAYSQSEAAGRVDLLTAPAGSSRATADRVRRPSGPPHVALGTVALGGATLAAAAATLVVVLARSGPSPRASGGDATAPVHGADSSVGTGALPVQRIETHEAAVTAQAGDAEIVVAPRSLLRVAGDSMRGTLVVIERGEASFAVAPRKGRPPFAVECADLRVEVLGTRFSVGVAPPAGSGLDEAEGGPASHRGGIGPSASETTAAAVAASAAYVVVHEGHVSVRARGTVTVLGPGERFPERHRPPPVGLAGDAGSDEPGGAAVDGARATGAVGASGGADLATSGRRGQESPAAGTEGRAPPPATHASSGSRRTSEVRSQPPPGSASEDLASRGVAAAGADPPVEPTSARFARAASLEARAPAEADALYAAIEREGGAWARTALFARGRLAHERGDRRAAKALLGAYLARYPRGPNAGDARALLEVLE